MDVGDQAHAEAYAWIAAIHATEDDFNPHGSGVVLDELRVLTCHHVVQNLAEKWVAFPKARGGANKVRRRVDHVVSPYAFNDVTDLVILVLAEPVPAGVSFAQLRFPDPAELVGKRWWAFGFPFDPVGSLGSSASGQIGDALGYGWVRLHRDSPDPLEHGFSGGGLWCPDYPAVVGIVGQADGQPGGGRAITLYEADQWFPGQDLASLAGRRMASGADDFSGTPMERVGDPYPDAVREPRSLEETSPDKEEAVLGAPVGMPSQSRTDQPTAPSTRAETEAPGRLSRQEPEWDAGVNDASCLWSGKLYQPMLFVGLGGTGAKIGVELERRLRQEICGPDGMKWISETGFNRLPYQLPSFLQFIYVDIDQSDLARLTELPPELTMAVGRTRHTHSDLLPALDSYPLVAQYLRARAEEEVRHFLPPSVREPRVAPLSRGAAQLPTVARACLFAKIRQHGIHAVQEPVTEAIRRLRGCAVDLDSLGGVDARVCNVFIACSVAGGIGCGVFYDYIHLVADAFSRTGIAIQIYPLVVLPSAFPDGAGGGRNARLNAGRGLLDLAQLVDDQNMRVVHSAYWPTKARRPDEHGVTYRDEHGAKSIQMAPSTLQTAFLFSNDSELTEAEMRASTASFVMSMAASTHSEYSARNGRSPGRQSTDINQGVDRQVLSPSGIGGRGMSTAFVTSLSVPRAAILNLFTACLIARAIDACSRGRPEEDNIPLVRAFFEATGLTPLVDRPYLAWRPQVGVLSLATLRMQRTLAELEDHAHQVRQRVDAMARGFVPMVGLEAIARSQSQAPGHIDPFRAERAIVGGSATPAVVTYLGRTPRPPAQPTGRERRKELAAWREVAATEEWTSAWQSQSTVWSPKVESLATSLRQLTTELNQFKHSSDARGAQDLYAILADNGTAYQFTHELPHDVDGFYRWFASRLARSLERDPGTDAEGLLTALLGEQDPWADLILTACDTSIGAARAVRRFRARVSDCILKQTSGDSVLLPHLADLIKPDAQARALQGAEAARNVMRRLVPTGALLEAAGPARAVITYPVRGIYTANGSQQADGWRQTRDAEVEAYLRKTIDIGAHAGQVTYDFRATPAETLTVILTRTALGIADIPEARQLAALWADAVRQGAVKDYLRWRQRLGYEAIWLLTTEEQRVTILQRLLIAMRNGQVDVLKGTYQRPTEIVIRASATPGSTALLWLPLRPWSGTSPWADLLHAYEESVFAGDELNWQELYAAIMEVMPLQHVTGQPTGPSDLYKAFLQVAQDEVAALKALLSSGAFDADQRPQVEGLLSFWTQTTPAALKKKIEGFHGLANTLEALR